MSVNWEIVFLVRVVDVVRAKLWASKFLSCRGVFRFRVLLLLLVERMNK